MNSITSEAHFRQRVLRYSEKNGVKQQVLDTEEADKRSMSGKRGTMGHGKV